jgi:hypothetical protein
MMSKIFWEKKGLWINAEFPLCGKNRGKEKQYRPTCQQKGTKTLAAGFRTGFPSDRAI